MNTIVSQKEWPADFVLDGLEGKALALATELRGWLESKFHLRPYTWIDDDDDPFEMDGCESGCKLFEADFSYTYSTGGHNSDIKYHSKDSGAMLHMVMDGGILYDFLSYKGDMAHEFPKSHDKYMTAIEKIAEKHDCEMEWVTSYCIGFYEVK